VRLYRDFATQEELDREYNPAAAVPESASITASWTVRSGRTRGALEARLGLRYGPTLDEHLDVFPAGPGAPVHVFVHGGYWRRFAAADFSFVAEPLVASGTAAVVVNYALCPAGSLAEIVRQVRASLAWTWANAASFGGDRDRITLSGHSAGGHLVAVALATDWEGGYGLPPDLVKGALAISGLFDLAPFPYTYLQPALQLTWDEVRRLSPVNALPSWAPPLAVAVGGRESAEFRRQSREFHELWRTRGLPGSLLEVEDSDHFTVLDALAWRPGGGLASGLLAVPPGPP
jgi:arylformamidase